MDGIGKLHGLNILVSSKAVCSDWLRDEALITVTLAHFSKEDLQVDEDIKLI